MGFTLVYYVCVLSGTLSNPQFEGCFTDRIQTSEPLTEEQCEVMRAELATKPHVLPNHDPKKGRLNLAVLAKSKCVQERDA